ncbi:MAG: hypothetical protein WC325_12085 [Candidatus Bathyarchaeia archaeon]
MISIEDNLLLTTTKNEQNLTPAEQQRQERIDQLITLLFIKKKDMKTACQTIGVSRTTGYEYFRSWQEQEEAQLVDTEFWSLFRQVKRRDPAKALDILSRIKVKKMAVQVDLKAELTETKTVTYNLNYSEEEKNAILTARRAILSKRSSTNQPPSLH